MTIYILVFNKLPYSIISKGLNDITNAIINFQLNLDRDNSIESEKNKRPISDGLKQFLKKMLEKDP